jgi:hypothetical protein
VLDSYRRPVAGPFEMLLRRRGFLRIQRDWEPLLSVVKSSLNKLSAAPQAARLRSAAISVNFNVVKANELVT